MWKPCWLISQYSAMNLFQESYYSEEIPGSVPKFQHDVVFLAPSTQLTSNWPSKEAANKSYSWHFILTQT